MQCNLLSIYLYSFYEQAQESLPSVKSQDIDKKKVSC